MLIDDEQFQTFLNLLKITRSDSVQEINSKLQSRLDYLFQFSQQYWLRHANTERWNMKDDEILKQSRSEIIALVTKLGFIEEIKPQKKQYNYVLLLGISEPESLISRINYVAKIWSQGVRFEKIFLLTGEINIEELWDKWKQQPNLSFEHTIKTDTELTESVYEQYAKTWPEDLRHISAISIATRAHKESNRPNTRDTLNEWKKINEQKNNLLIISNQPFVPYQKLVVENVLSSSYQTETVGEKINDVTPVSVILDSVARYLYEYKNKK